MNRMLSDRYMHVMLSPLVQQHPYTKYLNSMEYALIYATAPFRRQIDTYVILNDIHINTEVIVLSLECKSLHILQMPLPAWFGLGRRQSVLPAGRTCLSGFYTRLW